MSDKNTQEDIVTVFVTVCGLSAKMSGRSPRQIVEENLHKDWYIVDKLPQINSDHRYLVRRRGKLTTTSAPLLSVVADDPAMHAESVVACPGFVTVPADLPNSGSHVVITVPLIPVPRELLGWIREDLSSLLAEWQHKKDSKYRKEAQEWRDLHDRLEQVNLLLGE